MSYRIEYGPPFPRSRDKLPIRLIGLTALFFILFLLIVKTAWPAGREKLTRLLQPVGNTQDLRLAAQAFFADLKAGAPFYDSLTAFCQEIVSHAALPPV